MSWTDDALCAGAEMEIFFPPETGHGARYTEARTVCAACPVQRECLTEALRLEGDISLNYRKGMWGGHTPKQRYELHLARRRTEQAAA